MAKKKKRTSKTTKPKAKAKANAKAVARQRFDADLIEGHKGVVAAIVPFDPEKTFRAKPVRLAGRRHGWLVTGTVNGVAWDGYIGDRWGRFFVTLDDEMRQALEVGAGDSVTFALAPTKNDGVWKRAIEDSKTTTQPGRARADAISRGR